MVPQVSRLPFFFIKLSSVPLVSDQSQPVQKLEEANFIFILVHHNFQDPLASFPSSSYAPINLPYFSLSCMILRISSWVLNSSIPEIKGFISIQPSLRQNFDLIGLKENKRVADHHGRGLINEHMCNQRIVAFSLFGLIG